MSGSNPGTPARQTFTFQQGLDTEARQARALEYIAHYMDGIEAHLSVIARQVAPIKGQGVGQQLTEGLAFQLQALVKVAREGMEKP